MKKLLSIVLAVALVLSLTAVGIAAMADTAADENITWYTTNMVNANKWKYDGTMLGDGVMTGNGGTHTWINPLPDGPWIFMGEGNSEKCVMAGKMNFNGTQNKLKLHSFNAMTEPEGEHVAGEYFTIQALTADGWVDVAKVPVISGTYGANQLTPKMEQIVDMTESGKALQGTYDVRIRKDWKFAYIMGIEMGTTRNLNRVSESWKPVSGTASYELHPLTGAKALVAAADQKVTAGTMKFDGTQTKMALWSYNTLTEAEGTENGNFTLYAVVGGQEQAIGSGKFVAHAGSQKAYAVEVELNDTGKGLNGEVEIRISADVACNYVGLAANDGVNKDLPAGLTEIIEWGNYDMVSEESWQYVDSVSGDVYTDDKLGLAMEMNESDRKAILAGTMKFDGTQTLIGLQTFNDGSEPYGTKLTDYTVQAKVNGQWVEIAKVAYVASGGDKTQKLLTVGELNAAGKALNGDVEMRIQKDQKGGYVLGIVSDNYVAGTEPVEEENELAYEIAQIPTVLTYDVDKDTIELLKEKYDALSDEEKAEIDNYSRLETALNRIDQLKMSPLGETDYLTWTQTIKGSDPRWSVAENSPYGTTIVEGDAFLEIDHAWLQLDNVDFGEEGIQYIAVMLRNDIASTQDMLGDVHMQIADENGDFTVEIARRAMVGTGDKVSDEIMILNEAGQALRGVQTVRIYFEKFSNFHGLRLGVKSNKPYTDDPLRVSIWFTGKLSSWHGEFQDAVNTDLIADLESVYHEKAKNMYMQRPIDSTMWEEAGEYGAIKLNLYLDKALPEGAKLELLLTTGSNNGGKGKNPVSVDLTAQAELVQGWNSIVLYLMDLPEDYKKTDWVRLQLTGNDTDNLVALSKIDLVDMSKNDSESELLIPPYDTTGEDGDGYYYPDFEMEAPNAGTPGGSTDDGENGDGESSDGEDGENGEAGDDEFENVPTGVGSAVGGCAALALLSAAALVVVNRRKKQ